MSTDTYSLVYDAENRLTKVKKNGVVTATFGYDGDREMVTATVGGTSTFYLGDCCEFTLLYQEDFNDGVADGWTAYAGTWAVQSSAYRQSNTTHINTNAYRAFAQSQALIYRWSITFTSGTQAGVYLYASSAAGSERGNAYRVMSAK